MVRGTDTDIHIHIMCSVYREFRGNQYTKATCLSLYTQKIPQKPHSYLVETSSFETI